MNRELTKSILETLSDLIKSFDPRKVLGLVRQIKSADKKDQDRLFSMLRPLNHGGISSLLQQMVQNQKPQLMRDMREELKTMNVTIIQDLINKVKPSGSENFWEGVKTSLAQRAV